jgi:hypothetical protein
MKRRLIYHVLCLPIIIAVAVIYIFKIGGAGVSTFAGDSFLIVLCAIASTMLFTVVRSFKDWDSAKLTWSMILAGTITYLIAESLYFYLEVIKQVEEKALFPSIADIFYCSACFFFLAGLLIMIFAYLKSGLPMENWKIYFLAITVVFVLITGVMYVALLKPIALDNEIGGLEKFLYFFYPVSDLTIIFPSLIMIYITYLLGKGMFSRPWRALALGFLIMAVADMTYSYLDWQELYKTGNLIDLLWGVSYWLIGLSGVYQKEIMDSI